MEESNGTLFPARRPASAGGAGKSLFPLCRIFLPVIAACSAGPVPGERAKAFQGMIRERILSREETVRREPAAGDTAGIQALLGGLRNEMSRGRDRDRSPARFVLEGGIGGFYERRGRSEAVLNAALTLLGLRESDPTERVLFQKEYGFSRPMADGSPVDLARAMNLSTRDFTGEAIAGIRRAVRKAVASGVPAGS